MIGQVVDSWDAPDCPQCLAKSWYIRDQPQREGGQQPKPYKLQPITWHSQTKKGNTMIKGITGICRHLPEGFTRCTPAFYSPSISWENSSTVSQDPGVWRMWWTWQGTYGKS